MILPDIMDAISSVNAIAIHVHILINSTCLLCNLKSTQSHAINNSIHRPLTKSVPATWYPAFWHNMMKQKPSSAQSIRQWRGVLCVCQVDKYSIYPSWLRPFWVDEWSCSWLAGWALRKVLIIPIVRTIHVLRRCKHALLWLHTISTFFLFRGKYGEKWFHSKYKRHQKNLISACFIE